MLRCGTHFRHAALDHSAADAEFVANLRAGRLSEVPAEVGMTLGTGKPT